MSGFPRGRIYPVQAAFELTPRCNFRCKMCYVRLDGSAVGRYGRELSAEEWIRMGEAAAEAGTLRLTITGGEPLVREDFPQIYQELTEMGFLITLQTNLSLLDGRVMDLIADRPPVMIKSTLYGASEETYERVCGVKNGLARVRRGIENVRQAGIPLTLVSTIIKDNQPELDAIHRLAAEYGYPLQHTHNVLDSRRNENGDAASKLRIEFSSLCPEEKAKVDLKIHKPQGNPLEICGNYRFGGYWILWDGQMSLCAHMKMERRYEPLREAEKAAEKTENSRQNITGQDISRPDVSSFRTSGESEGQEARGNEIERCFYRMRKDLEEQYRKSGCGECQYGQYCTACPAVLYTRKISAGTEQCQALAKERVQKNEIETGKNR